MEFLSNKVKVFPSSLRTYNGMGKYTTENNLTGIPRSVTDYDSYLISRNKSDDPFKFVIHGYYFEVSGIEFPDEGLDDGVDKSLYIHIKVENTNEYSRLIDYDDNGTDIDFDDKFNAIAIDNKEPYDSPHVSSEDNFTIYTLRLTGPDGKLWEESFSKIDISSLGGDTVGCYEVEVSGKLGFSEPVYFEKGKPVEVNTIFWGDTAPTDTPNSFTNVDNEVVDVIPPRVGDIFFKITME